MAESSLVQRDVSRLKADYIDKLLPELAQFLVAGNKIDDESQNEMRECLSEIKSF